MNQHNCIRIKQDEAKVYQKLYDLLCGKEKERIEAMIDMSTPEELTTYFSVVWGLYI